ncbi:hypothetical protein B7494_g7795 [Chlorociboria aeruginascens]|nr:hypothetical protein B7494_g7795 [Chlorociboria aeruginascens]
MCINTPPKVSLTVSSSSIKPSPPSIHSTLHNFSNVNHSTLDNLSSIPTMCFFDQYQYTCGDYKWGHFRAHCTKEYRTGETCGMKLVMATYAAPEGGKCKLCIKIETKQNRIRKEEDRIARWSRENPKGRRASIEASEEIIRNLEQEISDIWHQRQEQATTLRCEHQSFQSK